MKIKLDNISKYYYSSNSVVPALRKIKLEFDIGEFVAITGESGSGKSTLLNIISGLDTYDDGELWVDQEATSGYDAVDWEEFRKNKIGFVFQTYSLIEHYSVLNNVESALLIQGYNSKDARNTARVLINRVGLGKQLHQRASKLSSGQKQRLSIARALAKNTDIIIADEPTGNLDSENGRQIMELLSELSKDRLIITVTHNYDEASEYVTRKVRLHDGEVVSDTMIRRGYAEKTTVTSSEEIGAASAASYESSPDKKEDEITNISEAVNNKEAKTSYNSTLPITAGLDSNDTDSNHRPDSSKPDIKSSFVDHNVRQSDSKIAWRFALMNITTQPGRVLLFLAFLVLMAGVSFFFLGRIYSNWDDIFTKEITKDYFFNTDMTRIIVKKPDNSPITKEDIEKLGKIKYIKMADRYDYANDINYFFVAGADYDYLYQEDNSTGSLERPKIVDLKNWNKFMKSSTCITEKDLAAGRMPETRNEAVIYSEDESILGTEQECYFANQNSWGYNEYYKTNLKIVGLLKKKTTQIYFSEELCRMLSLSMYDNYYMLSAAKNVLTNSYTVNIGFIPVIGDGLSGGELRVSCDLAGVNDKNITGEAKVAASVNGSYGSYDAVILVNYNESSSRIVEVSEDWFNELYPQKSSQASIYMKDYIDTDYVLDKLEGLGYEAVSPFRVSAGEYVYDLLSERNMTIFTSLIILAMLCILEILVVRSIMKIRNNDFTVLGSIGMSHKTIKEINYFEMYIYLVISILIVIAAANICGWFGFGYLAYMLKYYDTFTYSIFIVLNLVTVTLTVMLFNRYLKHKQKWSYYDKIKQIR